MAGIGQRTEKPTARRLERARKEGNFPSSREFLSSVQFVCFVAMISAFGRAWILRTARLMRALFAEAFTGDVTPARLMTLLRAVIVPEFVPLLLAGGAMVLMAVFVQLASTKMGISPTKLAPDFKRLNFLSKIKNLPGQNVPMFLQAALLLPVVGLVVYYEASENLDSFMELPWLSPQSSMVRVGGTLGNLMWRAAGLFLLVGLIDLVWQRHRYTKQLFMTKQEIRDESKEMQGNPQVKMRIRRLQRDFARRQMMKEIPTATAVIVNPTHYAVAIRYVMDAAAAPKVIAKGKNYLALRIRQKAIENQIPIIENPPLAQALYKSVDVGQEIPGHLYRAVAEILAYIYRLMNGRLPGA